VYHVTTITSTMTLLVIILMGMPSFVMPSDQIIDPRIITGSNNSDCEGTLHVSLSSSCKATYPTSSSNMDDAETTTSSFSRKNKRRGTNDSRERKDDKPSNKRNIRTRNYEDDYYYNNDDEYYYDFDRSEQEKEFMEHHVEEDLREGCTDWANRGECNINPFFMLVQCLPSCLKVHYPKGFQYDDWDDEEYNELLQEQHELRNDKYGRSGDEDEEEMINMRMQEMINPPDPVFGLGRWTILSLSNDTNEEVKDKNAKKLRKTATTQEEERKEQVKIDDAVDVVDNDEDCKNVYDDDECTQWAQMNRCLDDSVFMLEKCAKSCLVCTTPGQEIYIGPPQQIPDLHHFHDTLDVITKTHQYLKQTVYAGTNISPTSLAKTADYNEETQEELLHSNAKNNTTIANHPTTTDVATYNNYAKVRRSCINNHPMCAQWAAKGLCTPDEYNRDYEYMVLQCAPCCETCHYLDYDVRCPKAAIRSSLSSRDIDDESEEYMTINSIFERIVGERDLTKEQIKKGMIVGVDNDVSNDGNSLIIHQDNVKILSRPNNDSKGTKVTTAAEKNEILYKRQQETEIDEKDSRQQQKHHPWLITIDDFLTSEECQHIIQQGGEIGFDLSTTENVVNRQYRTSQTAWCDGSCSESPIVQSIIERISTLVSFPTETMERMQLLQYGKGEFYKEHHDWSFATKRVLTFYMYLSDVEEGGGTKFPALGKTVQPKEGRVVLWPNVLDENPNEPDYATNHEALPVVKGMKYGSNVWLYLRDIKNRFDFRCEES